MYNAIVLEVLAELCSHQLLRSLSSL